MLTALILVFALAGTSAWFVSQVDGGLSDIILGDVGLKANFDADQDDVLLEPGLSVTKTATFKNSGTLALCAKLDLDTQITVYRDANGEFLADPAGELAPAGDDYVNVTIDFDNLVAEDVIEIDGEYYIYAWLYDVNDPDQLYLFADPGITANMDFIVDISGDTPNQYMGAKISFAKSMKATQLLPEAIQAELGVNVDDLEYVSVAQTNGLSLWRVNAKHMIIQNWVDEQLGR